MTHPKYYKPLHIKQLYFLMTVSDRIPENKKRKIITEQKINFFFCCSAGKISDTFSAKK